MKQSAQRRQRILHLFKARELVTLAVLTVSLLVTYRIWEGAERDAQQNLNTAFDFRVRESNIRIEQRLAIYEQILRATVGLFASADTVTRNEFRAFVSSLSLQDMFPGIQGVGLSLIVPPAEKDAHVASVRAGGFPEYDIRPPGSREVYTSIVYLEPFFGSNLRAFGFDMFSEPSRRIAMEEARDSGTAAISAKVVLVQESGNEVQDGFLMYLPVFRNNVSRATVEERRANILGWVYAPFRMNDFMRGAAGELASDLDVEIYDGEQVNPDALMYDSHAEMSPGAQASKLRRVAYIHAGSRTWTVVTSAMPQFDVRMQSDRPKLILQSGISISLLIALLIWLFLDDRARALQAADQAMQLALYDALTGLPNRKLLDERLAVELVKARRDHSHVALLFIDLDKFKPVNDAYGHAYGDLLLKEVSRRLQSCMRESDTASRLGGDEFVALLSRIEDDEATLRVADKILNRITEPYEIAGHTFHISASIGVAVYPDDGSDGKSLIRSADMAMYAAKSAGRANVKLAERVQ
ncbi:CHASE domain-containing protein [Noviherbaspirillum sp. CPCC 100848]|uniref:CHASE domain-containing protein n=1 Tax=Noviherbaspirillum album TaxID=3080276 RepID=A0ABU6J5G8_9BURK|nr:CHASE domain-containing protein [Noviherbaspirillum sp. CPCC 100848]MEC4718892.1 CHASE domain-containing protein [Noviherbaspirillum sp. CPCC 100848]